MTLKEILDQIWVMPEESRQELQKHIHEVSFPKGYNLMGIDKVETSVYFVKKGIVRAYVLQDGNEITFWFGKEGNTVISMRSYVENKPGYENIELLEVCELYELKIDSLRKLYQQDIHIANWGRRLAEQELIKTEERLISRQVRAAGERYRDLMKQHPEFLQRIQLGYIASYLGITQVSLSRIRAEIR
ncbi:CRP-like cAMP-binding protein [Elizabethkingia sp. YR214]|uniref:Crp/Fnr family transcriptional regulator n=1 Tax=Elizabethkingia sp. YR214 TaxID=2135667 RepID=UPI000D301635|nr:Crp/Fnr family transcriptional regulator [Elizabethkingia sp. YR214]PUB32901.1 CRP-like cAMP-binding protein [Elizabethkingia sp. YR214]